MYNGHGDVVNLTDATGTSVASDAYDTWGNLTASSESFAGGTGWINPSRYDGRDGVRSDVASGLDWMSVRAYDPTLGRFLSRDPLNRAPLFFADNPYVYAGNNPLSNVDPSGQYRAAGHGATTRSEPQQYRAPARVTTAVGTPMLTCAGAHPGRSRSARAYTFTCCRCASGVGLHISVNNPRAFAGAT